MAIDYKQYVIDKLYELSKHGLEDFISIDKTSKDRDSFIFDFIKASEQSALNNVKKLVLDKTGKITFELYDQLDILAMLDKVSNGSVKLDELSNEQSKTLTLEQIIRSRKKVSTEEESDDD